MPQARQRTIFVGVRADLAERFGVAPVFPTPFPYSYSIRDAIPDIATKVTDVEPEADIAKYCTGREYDKLLPGEQSDRYFNLVRTAANKPCPTILASHGSPGIASIMHPFEKRKFSIRELKRLSSFPEDFVLTGSYEQKYERIGRAVPPLAMKAIAETIRTRILDPIRDAEAQQPKP